MNALQNKEPLLTVGVIVTGISVILSFLKSFGVDITQEQQDAIRDVAVWVAPIVLALIARQFVFSPNTTQKLVDEAYSALPGPGGDHKPEVKL
jgi:hypothetical protein